MPHKYLIFLIYLLSFGFTACAPQRATFSFPRKKNASTQNSQLSSLPAPAALSVVVDDAQKLNLVTLVQDLDVNTSRLEEGMFRVTRRELPSLKKTEYQKQTVLSVTDEEALVETTDVESGASILKKKIKLEDTDPLEKGIRDLAQGNYQLLYSRIAFYLLLNQEVTRESIAHEHVDMTVKSARYNVDNSVFRILVSVKLSSKPDRPIGFEVRFAPSMPRPFNVIYQAWGRTAKNTIMSMQPLLNTTDSFPHPKAVRATEVPTVNQ
jgi:hypothetical protein